MSAASFAQGSALLWPTIHCCYLAFPTRVVTALALQILEILAVLGGKGCGVQEVWAALPGAAQGFLSAPLADFGVVA